MNEHLIERAGDFYGSRDLEDIVTLVGGRAELIDDVRGGSGEVRGFVAERCRKLLDQSGFHNALPGLVIPEARIDMVVLPRLEALAALG